MILHLDASRTQPRHFEGFAQHPRNRLLMKHDFLGEQRLIMPGCAGIAFAGNIRGSQGGAGTRLVQRRSNIQPYQLGMSMRRQHRPCVQQLGEARRQVVRVECFAGDVAARAFMRDRLANNLHATASSCCSHQNFCRSDWANAKR